MFILYYKPGCPYSIKAHELLKNKKIDHIKIDLSSSSEDIDIRNYINQKHNHRTMPIIFFKSSNEMEGGERDNKCLEKTYIDKLNNFIGGYSDINKLISTIDNINKDNIKDAYLKNYSNDSLNNISYRDYLKIAIFANKK